MKFYLMTDIEGVAGVTEFEDRASDTLMNHHVRRRWQQLLTAEVNAAVDGLYAAGATCVIVNDGHGAGVSIDVEDLDERAQLVHGLQRPHWLPLLDASCAATMHLGAHGKACTWPAVAYHTMNRSIRDWRLNGVSIGEMGLQAAIAGDHGVPFIYCAGDHHACLEAAQLIPGCVTTAVKKGLSRRSAVTWAPAKARRLIRDDIQRAVEALPEIAPYVVEPPLVLLEERFDEAFPNATSTDSIVYHAPNCRELRAGSLPELLKLLYGYDPAWHETALGE
ncbi:MAG: M55 family metallopeptidase [Fimbriimonadaceae bacterium]|nr:M55 family metallopeptidase [Fimbriimonadaceae bacterium]